jgi:hypothetical protein
MKSLLFRSGRSAFNGRLRGTGNDVEAARPCRCFNRLAISRNFCLIIGHNQFAVGCPAAKNLCRSTRQDQQVQYNRQQQESFHNNLRNMCVLKYKRQPGIGQEHGRSATHTSRGAEGQRQNTEIIRLDWAQGARPSIEFLRCSPETS